MIIWCACPMSINYLLKLFGKLQLDRQRCIGEPSLQYPNKIQILISINIPNNIRSLCIYRNDSHTLSQAPNRTYWHFWCCCCYSSFLFSRFHFSWLSFPFFTRWTKTSFRTCITNYSWLLTLKLLSISVSMHCWSCVIGESVYLYGDFHCHVCNWSIKMNRRIVIFIWTSIVWLMFVGHFYIITTQKEHIEKETYI